jgi:transcriptional regulator with XRE-family HTH domain
MAQRRQRVQPVELVIGRRIRELRLSRDMTQVELAAKIGMNQSVLSQCEQGQVRVHGALLLALMKALRVSADELLGATGIERRPSNGRLLRRLDRIERLSRAKQRVVLEMVDAFLDKHAREPRD